ncbi:MAG: DUF108 domain-containing protein [Burkholderiaceae bacterium]|nr:DUF108 domain-containing protein [Burkholderiaceae bacterium]
MQTVSLIGAGALAREFAANLGVLNGEWTIKSVLGRSPERLDAFCQDFHCEGFTDFEAFIETAGDVVIELAGKPAAQRYAVDVLKTGRRWVSVSIGAYVDEAFRQEVIEAARDHRTEVHLPHGAIGGLDYLLTSSLYKTTPTVAIETRKGLKGLQGAPGMEGLEVDPTRETVVFEGSVQDAVAAFPKNINVAAAASLASDNPNITVRIICSPDAKNNGHRITLDNGLWSGSMQFASLPDPANPKTSISTAWSVLALLKNLSSPLRFF